MEIVARMDLYHNKHNHTNKILTDAQFQHLKRNWGMYYYTSIALYFRDMWKCVKQAIDKT